VLWQLLDQYPIEAQAINLTEGISSGEHKLCNSQKNLTRNHNSILLTIYISIHGLCYDYTSSYPNVYALSSCSLCQDHWQWTLFFSLFYFTFLFLFLFLEQLGLGFISHTVTSVTNWWHSHKTDHKTWEKEVEGSKTK